MKPIYQTRKPVVKLTPDDLEVFPVWEYVDGEVGSGEMDETWVRPAAGSHVPKNAYSQLAAADFQIVAGVKAVGFMVVTTANGVIDLQPGSIVSGGYLVLPTVSDQVAVRENYTWSLKDRRKVVEVFGRAGQKVFPIKYQLRVFVSGETELRKGTIE